MDNSGLVSANWVFSAALQVPSGQFMVSAWPIQTLKADSRCTHTSVHATVALCRSAAQSVTLTLESNAEKHTGCFWNTDFDCSIAVNDCWGVWISHRVSGEFTASHCVWAPSMETNVQIKAPAVKTSVTNLPKMSYEVENEGKSPLKQMHEVKHWTSSWFTVLQ